MRKLFIYSILVFLVFSCRKKELPQEQPTERVFYVNCNIDGVATKMEAGNSDYYMATSCGRDSNIYFFRGDLAQTSYASGRDYAISVIVSDYRVTNTTELVNVDSVLLPGNHLYNAQIIPGNTQTVSFVPVKPESSGTFTWSLTDGNSDLRSYTSYSVVESLPVGKTYTMMLNYNDIQGSCQQTHRNVFRIGNRLQTTISAKRDSTNLSEQRYELSYTIPPGQAPFNCKWSFADQTVSTTYKTTKVFSLGQTQIIRLDLYNAMGDTCTSFYQLNPVNGQPCHANYMAKFQPVKNTSIFSTVKILLTDKNGRVYSSGELVQPETSYFKIEGSDPYKTNDQGQATRSVKIKFNCVVSDGTKSIRLENGEALIAVAHQ